jgi:hypothetical protein
MKTKLLIALAHPGRVRKFTTSCRQDRDAVTPDPLARAYDSEPDWNDARSM